MDELLTRLNAINPQRGKAHNLIWEIHKLAAPLNIDAIIEKLKELHDHAYGMKPHRPELEDLLRLAVRIQGTTNEN